jgi:beta-lactamase class A
MVMAGLATVSASAAIQVAPPPAQPQPAPPVTRHVPPPQTPIYLRDRVTALGRGFDGRVGIAVRSVNEGWQMGWKADELYPQQSVSKLWVSIAALDAVDKGRVRLDDKVTLTRSDLTLFHQPIASMILGGG